MNTSGTELPLDSGRPFASRPAESTHAPQSPLRVALLAYAPTAFFHCMHCEFVFQQVDLGQKVHAEQNAGALPDDLQQEYTALSDWIAHLVERHCGRVEVQVIDVASAEGIWKALRHRVRRFPAVVVHNRTLSFGRDFAKAEEVIEQALARGA